MIGIMEKVNPTVRHYGHAVTFVAIWGLLILVLDARDAIDGGDLLRRFPLAVTIYALAHFLFAKWLWRLPILQGWLIKLPDLQGTWRGELKSDWKDPATGQGVAPKSVLLVIRQTYTSISCTLLTEESSSYSIAAEITPLGGDGELYLCYSYTNKTKAMVKDRSPDHDGATILKIIRIPDRKLEGYYWTARKTRGDMVFSFESKDLSETFS